MSIKKKRIKEKMTNNMNSIRNSCTFRLRKKPTTFVEGFICSLTTFNEISEKYNIDKTDVEADTKALRCDWEAVGKDMYVALDKYDRELTTE